MKNTTLPAQHHNATLCNNLRPDPSSPDTHLVPVPAPAPIDNIAWRTIGMYSSDTDGDINGTITEIFNAGSMLAIATYPANASAPPHPQIIAYNITGYLTGSYRCADGYIAFGIDSRYLISCDTDGVTHVCHPLPDPADYPTVTTLITSETTMNIPVSGFSLTGAYSSATDTLEPRDAMAAASAMADAYNRACYIAASAGAFISPLFSRYRLYDSHGNILFTSLPKLHVPTTRHDSLMTTTLTLAGSRVNTGHISVARFELGATVATPVNTDAARRVSRLEIQLTPQLHTVDPALWPLHRLDIASSSLRVTAPGCDDPTLVRQLILDILPDIDSVFYTAATVTNPFAAVTSSASTVRVKGKFNSVTTDKSILSRHTPPAGPHWLYCCRQPHALYAEAVYRDGDITFMANIHAKPFPGHHLEYFTNSASTADATLSAAIVTFADGSQVVSHNSTDWWRNTILSPLIIYPDPTAVSITLQLCDSSGNNRSVSLPLTPCGHAAIYLADTLEPFPLDSTTADFHIPSSTATTRQLPGHLVAVDTAGNISGTTVSAGRINAITPTPQPSTSHWERSRSRLYIFSSDGIYSLATSGLQLSTPVLLDSRPVHSRYAVAEIKTPAPAVAAIAARDLVTVSGNKVTTIATDIDASMLVWCGRYSELLAVTRSATASIPSRALVYHTTAGGWSYREYPPLSSVFSHPVASRLTSSIHATVYDLAHDLSTPVTCSCTYPLLRDNSLPPAILPFVTEVIYDITGSDITGSVTIVAHNGLPPAAVMSQFSIKGCLQRPVYLHTIMPRRSHIDLTVTASMSLDTHLAPPCIRLTTKPVGQPSR